MAIFIQADSSMTAFGSTEFVHAFFSTISFNLEPNGWGTRFPAIMVELYQGELRKVSAQSAISELKLIKQEFEKLSPSNVVWDIENLSLQPPWGIDIAEDITSLGNYFVTSEGGDVFDALFENIEYLMDEPSCKAIQLISF